MPAIYEEQGTCTLHSVLAGRLGMPYEPVNFADTGEELIEVVAAGRLPEGYEKSYKTQVWPDDLKRAQGMAAAYLERRRAERERRLRERLAPTPKRPEPLTVVPVEPPPGSLVTNELTGRVACRVLRRHPSDFAPSTLALAEATPQLRRLVPMRDDELYQDRELGPSYVLGPARQVEVVEEAYRDTTPYHPRTPDAFFQSFRLLEIRDGWKPADWHLLADVASVTKDYARGQRATKARLDPATLAERLERLEEGGRR